MVKNGSGVYSTVHPSPSIPFKICLFLSLLFSGFPLRRQDRPTQSTSSRPDHLYRIFGSRSVTSSDNRLWRKYGLGGEFNGFDYSTAICSSKYSKYGWH